jgi:hypothetical protein
MTASMLKRRAASAADDQPLHQEHQLLIRKVAALQSRVSDLVQAHLRVQRTMEAEIVRLRAQAMVDRTQRLWALPEQPRPRREPSRQPMADDPSPGGREAADAVICQTGCVGHAHPWLQADGGCSRTGRVCTELLPELRLQATTPTQLNAARARNRPGDATDDLRVVRPNQV